jgi:hypothetical protein
MEPIEYLVQCQELRSFFKFFRDKSPCSGIRWLKEEGSDIAAGETLGQFLFTGHAPVPFTSPIDGVLAVRYDVPGSSLHQRPSQLIALLAPPRTRAPDYDAWFDIAPAYRH